MAKQRTLKQSFTIEGQGLHTGLDIKATFYPAPDNFGYKFKRTDLDNTPVIAVLAENVTEVTRGTVLEKNGVKISTIEHAMATLYAAEIDNCLIEINAPEMPILDGSARFYAEAVEKAGVEEQSEDKDYYIVQKKIEYRNEETGSSIIILPDDGFSIHALINFDSPVLSSQYATLDKLSDFKNEIASCRTFVFVKEIEPLLKNNLIKGGTLDNAIVIYDQKIPQLEIDRLAKLMHQPTQNAECLGYLNAKPLQFCNEPARHKLLDVIGDLALIGKPIKGKVIATKPGHSTNCMFAKIIRKKIKRTEVSVPIYDPNTEPVFDINKIKSLLPHRYPFLLVDKIIELTDKVAVGIKNVTTNEPFFEGHFPEEPVMPGVLILEAMAQTGGMLALKMIEKPNLYSPYFIKIDKVKFRQKVMPGDTLIFRLELLTPIRRGCLELKGYAFVGRRIVAEAEFMAQIIKNK